MTSDFSKNIKTSINGDEYYTPQNCVDMIMPYITRGGTKLYGVHSIKKKVIL